MTEARKWRARKVSNEDGWEVITPTPPGELYKCLIAHYLTEGDAHLIAAAPDLYEAGKAICAALEASWNETDEVPGFAELKAALAKAEGRE